MLVSQAGEFTDKLYYMNNSEFEFEVFPSIGFYYKVNMPFINERLYFQYEASYSKVDLKNSTTFTEPVYDVIYLNEMSLSLNSFNNLAIIKYEVPKGNVRPTFQMGGFVNYFFNTEYSRNLEIQYPWSDTHDLVEISKSPFENYDYGFSLGLGLSSLILKDKELSINYRYQRGFGLLQELKTDTHLINIGFQIGK